MDKALGLNIWKKLALLSQKDGKMKLTDLAQELGFEGSKVLEVLRAASSIGIKSRVYQSGKESWVKIDGSCTQYLLNLSPGEWIHLHLLLSKIEADLPVHQVLQHKVSGNGPIKVVMELLNQLELWDQELSENEQRLLRNIETSVKEKHFVGLTTKDERSYFGYPCRILHLEGQLSLIAEDSKDHCLFIVPLKEVQKVEPIPSSGVPKVSPFEIEEFITAIRAMSEKETRLILKIHDPNSVNLFPDHHFLGKPCMITNPNGDLIWAAYVEPCHDLFDWLMALGKKVEILDPLKFKEEYLTYCEEKMRKIA